MTASQDEEPWPSCEMGHVLQSDDADDWDDCEGCRLIDEVCDWLGIPWIVYVKVFGDHLFEADAFAKALDLLEGDEDEHRQAIAAQAKSEPHPHVKGQLGLFEVPA